MAATGPAQRLERDAPACSRPTPVPDKHRFEHGRVFEYGHELPATARFLLAHRRPAGGGG
jgi:hypothetical protein